MTKRPQRERDFDEFPITEIEMMQIKKAQRRQKRQGLRWAIREAFNRRAHDNNVKYGISPKQTRYAT